MNAHRVACIVPAFNAAPTIASVLGGIRVALPESTTIVVDDGSSDDTGAVSRAAADAVVKLARNQGKGAALRAGFALALAEGYDTILTLDADGQHDPRFAPTLVISLQTADIAIGARARRSPEMPLGRRITNRLSAAAVGRCIGQPVADAQSGFRALRAEVVRTVRPRGDRYEFETEFLLIAGRRGYRVSFVPIPTHYPGIVPSHFRIVRDSARVVETIWRFRRGAEV